MDDCVRDWDLRKGEKVTREIGLFLRINVGVFFFVMGGSVYVVQVMTGKLDVFVTFML